MGTLKKGVINVVTGSKAVFTRMSHLLGFDWLCNNYFLLAANCVLLGSLAFDQQCRRSTQFSVSFIFW